MSLCAIVGRASSISAASRECLGDSRRANLPSRLVFSTRDVWIVFEQPKVSFMYCLPRFGRIDRPLGTLLAYAHRCSQPLVRWHYRNLADVDFISARNSGR